MVAFSPGFLPQRRRVKLAEQAETRCLALNPSAVGKLRETIVQPPIYGDLEYGL